MKSKNITNWFLVATLTSIMTACGGSGGTSNSGSENNRTQNNNEETSNTVADTEVPTVLSVSPSDLETEVALDVNVSILFDKNMLASSLNKSSIILKKANNTLVDGNVIFNATNTATFSPNKKLALLSEYVLTLNSTVSDLVGNTLENEEKYNFTTRDGKWQEAKLLEINNGSAEEPQIAFDSSGNAIAVWSQIDETGYYSIFANHFTPTTGWRGAEKIENNNGNVASLQISMDSEGNAIAVWEQFDGTIDNIWANRFTPTLRWAGAEKIEKGSGDVSSPKISMDSEGNALVVWSQHNGIRYNILANRFTPDMGWDNAKTIEKDDSGDAEYPQISMDSVGNAIVVWSQFNGARYIIGTNQFTSIAGWGSAEKIEIDNNISAILPQIAMDNRGNAIAIWSQFDGTKQDVWANRFTPRSRWGKAEKIGGNGSVQYPQISMNSVGNAIVVWQQGHGVGFNIWANQFSPTDRWSNAENIDDDIGSVISPQVSIDSAGNSIVVWNQLGETRSNIRANRFTPTGGWKGSEEIEKDDRGSTHSPQISIDSAGNAIAVWSQSDGTRANIMVNHFE